MTRRRATWAALCAAALVTSSACSASSAEVAGDPLAGQPVPGEGVTLAFAEAPVPVPAFDLVDLDGRRIDRASWAGKVVVLNFWATWCGPCRREIPDLIDLQERYRDFVVVVGLSLDDGPPELVKQFAQAQKINYPIAIVGPEVQEQFGGINAVPSTFIVNRDGLVTQRHVGLLRAERTEQEVRALSGLPTAATVAYDPKLGPRLLNRSEYQEVMPGVDLNGLSPAEKVAALKELNTVKCSCGCGLTVAQCLVDDQSCGVSPEMAKDIMAKMKAK